MPIADIISFAITIKFVFLRFKMCILMDQLSLIRKPIENELKEYKVLFDSCFTHEDEYLNTALQYVGSRQGKMMRPILVLLVAREFGPVREATLRSAVALELLHTSSLIHDDVVDESGKRRGHASANAIYGNKVAVLVGDYILAATLHQAALTKDVRIVDIIALLGGTLSEGEVRQLANIRSEVSTEEAYFHIIQRKTAALFTACARLGALSAGAPESLAEEISKFAEIVGVCFQIRDDIFDYYEDSNIGKPTGNDMAEGKLTLPAIYAVNHTERQDVRDWAAKVKAGTATREEISNLVEYTKQAGGIDYARNTMERLRTEALGILDNFQNVEVREALLRYLDFTIGRDL